MAESSDVVFYRYSPELMPEDVLRKLFVGRGKLLESLFEELKSAAEKKTPRFYLIVGPRGIGKSHFLVLLYYEIKNKLGSLLIPIKLAEEEYSVFRASDLLLRLLEEQSVETSDILALGGEDEILHAALEKLIQLSEEAGRTYLIFIENLHELFRQFDTAELQKLRSIFQRYDIFSVVASSPMIFPGISEHDEPFYGFFRTQHLREFSRDEITTLIQKIAEVEGNREFIEEFKQYEERIHGMMHLTGGSPRLVILFYEMITRGELKDTEKAFFKIIDEHTSYYREVFQLLTGQRRRLFDILIAAGAPATPKQIAERSRISDATVVSQLRRLEKDGYVISRRDGRHTYYEVRERLFRLWREMRQPFGRKRVSILLEFLQLWYTPKERDDGGLTTATTRDTKQGDEPSVCEECLLLSVGGYAKVRDSAENVEDFVGICLKLALDELKAENIGNAARLMKMAYDAGTDPEAGEADVLAMTITFLKDAVASGEITVIKTAVGEVIRLWGARYRKLLKPLIKAIEIVETGDIKRYYSLQVEEREIVADLVRSITGSDELLPS